jgi:preprotein translocase subunit YajC
MAAHDNSVTSLQFDNKIIVTGGSDGYVKVTTIPESKTDEIDMGSSDRSIYS